MKPSLLLAAILSYGCATTHKAPPPPVPDLTPIAAFAIACQSATGLIPQSIYIVFNKRLALHWTKTGVTMMELDKNGLEQDTEVGPVPFDSILALAKTADIVDELKLGYGCDVIETGI